MSAIPTSNQHAAGSYIAQASGGGIAVIGENNTIYAAGPPPLPLQYLPLVENFTDRTEIIQNLLQRMEPGQVVTLCGPGGIGKTAIVAKLLATLAPNLADPPARFPDGVVYHTFYDGARTDIVLEHIARSFGEEPSPTPSSAAQRALNGKQALLILDGAEAAESLESVLKVRGACGVLVTSRRRQDALDYRADITPLPRESAVELLNAWGKEYMTDREIGEQICNLLGDLPLALHLAGRYMEQQAIEAADYLAWLTESPLATLAHDGSDQEDGIPVLLQQSITQLVQKTQQAMAIAGALPLVPFEPGAIAAGLNLDSSSLAVRLLGPAVNYGLLVRTGSTYVISHALIHTYIRTTMPISLVELQRLAAYYTALVREQWSQKAASLQQLDQARPHVLHLLEQCRKAELWSPALEMAQTFLEYLELQGHWTERVDAVLIALEAVRALKMRKAEGRWLGDFGKARAALGQNQEAVALYQSALAIAEEVGDEFAKATHLGRLGAMNASVGDLRQAIDNFSQALRITQALGDRRGQGIHLDSLGRSYYALGQVQRALPFFQQVLEITRETDDLRRMSYGLSNLGKAYAALGQVTEAIEYFEQALEQACAVGDRHSEGFNLANLGGAHYAMGNFEQARQYDEQALIIAQDMGDRLGEGHCYGYLGNVYAALGNLAKALEHHQQALDIAVEIGDRRAEGIHLANLGNIHHQLNQLEQAVTAYKESLDIAREIGHKHGEAKRLVKLGAVWSARGDIEQALAFYEQGLQVSRAIGHRRREREALSNLGNIAEQQQDLAQAREYYQQAATIANEISDRGSEGLCLAYLGRLHLQLSEHSEAQTYLTQALQILESIGSSQAEWVRQLSKDSPLNHSGT
ncbi:MAG: tetratricopeptide repeat protein [Caldilineaceae bacterium]|nr:tetratricopeptide repeat protein [Caldilineaceae bacterium]